MATTFSQLVDEMVLESKRLDLRTEIATYVNQTVREIHFRADTNAPLHYSSNFNELQLTADSEQSFGWDIPNPATFQALSAVSFPSIYSPDGGPTWSRERTPSRALNQERYYHYRVGNRYVFAGYGGNGAFINLGFYTYPSRLKYYAPDARPCTYDDVLGFDYLADYDVNDATRLLAEQLCTNWVLLRWHDVIAEGVRAKIFKRVSDEVRQRTSYSMFQQLRQGLWTSEVADLGGQL